MSELYYILIDQIETYVTIGFLIVAAASLLIAALEYKRRGSQHRTQFFYELRERQKSDMEFQRICMLLENDLGELADIPVQNRMSFLGKYEEVALAVNSKLVRPEVAHYMFGYYAIRCWKSANFWRGINRDGLYWNQFARFCQRMQEIENSMGKYVNRNLRF